MDSKTARRQDTWQPGHGVDDAAAITPLLGTCHEEEAVAFSPPGQRGAGLILVVLVM